MKHRIVLLFILIPLSLSAKEFDIPIGTMGNKILFHVYNSTSQDYQNAKVIVKSKPDWIKFNHEAILVGNLKAHESKEIVYEFNVKNIDSDLSALIIFSVADENGIAIFEHVVKIHTIQNKSLTVTSKIESVFPNPANPATTITYSLKEESYVQLSIYNILGQKVRKLVDETKPQGVWQINWNGRNDNDNAISSGPYLIRLRVQNNATGKIDHYSQKILISK